ARLGRKIGYDLKHAGAGVPQPLCDAGKLVTGGAQRGDRLARDALAFGFLLVVLMIRPQGLLGGR
ncbi:MAG: hypothetical protein ACE5FS_02420, partial [Paracoccaceae bacterium]